MKKITLFLLFSVFPLVVCFADISVVGELSRLKSVRAGEKTEGVILIKNISDEPFQARVYLTDYQYFADGTNIYGEAGSAPRSNAKWVSLRPTQLTIPANETGSIYYTVNVPQDATLNGTYWSMVMVESLPVESLKSLAREKGKAKMGLRTIVRYGIQLVTDIEDSGKPVLKFTDKRLVAEDGSKFLRIDMENTGARQIAPSVWLELYNKEGKSIGRFDSSKMRIYPGCSVRHSFDLTDVPKGAYKGLVVVDGGDQNVFGAQYDFEIGSQQKIMQKTETKAQETQKEKPPSNPKSWINQVLEKIKRFFSAKK